MGALFSSCKKTKTRKKKKVDKEEKKIIFSFSKDGLKKDIDLVGQDNYDVIDKELGEGIKYFAVYDGHGIRGKLASNYAKDEIRKGMIKDKSSINKIKDRKEAEKYFKSLFNSVQKKFNKHSDIYDLSGTCVIAILIIDINCYIINLGDSRAVIGAKQSTQKLAYQMSIDHKPNREDERKRIDSTGGIVTNERNGVIGPPRIYSANEDGPGLAVSRTLGDIYGHSVGVSHEPEVSYKELDYSEDKFIVIGSDGVWDVMNSSEVVGFVYEKEKVAKEKIAEDLVGECRVRWEKVNDYKQKVTDLKTKDIDKRKTNSSNNIFSIDDITVIICYLNMDI